MTCPVCGICTRIRTISKPRNYHQLLAMQRKFQAIMFTDSVKAAQERYTERPPIAHDKPEEVEIDQLGESEFEFIRERDSFYLATVNEDGWPYMQFRGGPAGFVKPLDGNALGFVDFSGNRHFVSTGNVAANDRVSIFFMDYANKRRLKILAHAAITEAAANPELLEAVSLGDYRGRVERVVRLDVVAFEWSCPQHITPRFTQEEFREMGL